MKWRHVPLGEVARVDRSSVAPEKICDGTTYVGLENIKSGGGFVDVTPVTRGQLASTKFVFGGEHVLYGKLRPYLAKIEAPDFAGVCSTDILPIRPGPELNRRYLLHFLRQPSQVALADSRSSGANLPRLSPAELERFAIPLPPLLEQRRIASILDHAYTLRTKRRAAVTCLEELSQSIFVSMFSTDLEEARTISLGEALSSIDSGRSPKCLKRSATHDEYGVLKLSAVTTGTYLSGENKALPPDERFDQNNEVRDGDLLFTRKNTRDLVAACAYVKTTPPRMLLPDLIFRLNLRAGSGLDQRYVQRVLMYPRIRKRVQRLAGGSAGSMPNISKARLASVAIPRPSVDKQEQFRQRVEKVEDLKARLIEESSRGDALFASLQSRAFRGEL